MSVPFPRFAVPRRWRARTLTALAALVVFLALIAPNLISRLTAPAGYLRIPVEGFLGVALMLVLPARARRITAGVLGAVLGVLTVIKIVDMGFFETLARPFDVILDWSLFDDAYDFLVESAGRAGALGALIAVALLALAVPALTTVCAIRVAGAVGRHRTASLRGALAAALAWLLCFLLGAQISPGVSVAARSTAMYAYDRVLAARDGLRDEREFTADVAVDPYRDMPADRLLAGLRGKDVIFAFVESYGRSAVQDPRMAPRVDAVLDAGTKQLRAAGYASRSAFLTSPTFGGGSWLAHSTFLSGVWISNQQRYRNLTSGDRLTLTSAFGKAGHETVSVMPGATRAWPEGSFYGYDRVWDSRNLGYRGPKFSWAPMPDQYTMSAFESREFARPGRGPLMAEIPLVSSHTPWAPIPHLVGWDEVGDGSVFAGIAAQAKKPGSVWKDPEAIRTEYRKSIEYSLGTLISWMSRYGGDDTVLVFLGDHQPSPIVVGDGASHDVPISLVAKDPAVLDRIAGWGWQDGLRPGPQAPVWRMDAFRDRFLGAFSAPPGTRVQAQARR
ncbi:sulfatase [Mangrovihabitans endophyticus]|uniref:sulfatase n=1 Tax=Mangrovihabitans endophyticus TaxID=1751298 RepID=UPI001E481370|nr:sulfatase [Mangrovihabitans endophyticus]